jgi:hypothetical protein
VLRELPSLRLARKHRGERVSLPLHFTKEGNVSRQTHQPTCICLTALLLAVTGLAALATVVILSLPNSVEVGAGKAVFFDCGSALRPTTEPAQEPGISACRNANKQMRTTASVSAAAALGTGALGTFLLIRTRRSTYSTGHPGNDSVAGA